MNRLAWGLQWRSPHSPPWVCGRVICSAGSWRMARCGCGPWHRWMWPSCRSLPAYECLRPLCGSAGAVSVHRWPGPEAAACSAAGDDHLSAPIPPAIRGTQCAARPRPSSFIRPTSASCSSTWRISSRLMPGHSCSMELTGKGTSCRKQPMPSQMPINPKNANECPCWHSWIACAEVGPGVEQPNGESGVLLRLA